MPLDLNKLATEVHEWAVGKGFYDHLFLTYPGGSVENPSLPSEKLALMHSEVSEMLDALRDGDMEHEAEEACDLAIRLLDYAGWRGIDLEAGIEKKMATNRERPYLHGRVF